MMENRDISRNDLLTAIRKQGIELMAEVAFAVLEVDGSISLIRTDGENDRTIACPLRLWVAKARTMRMAKRAMATLNTIRVTPHAARIKAPEASLGAYHQQSARTLQTMPPQSENPA